MNSEDVKLIVLFGSQTNGRASANSDVDIAVLADHLLGLEEKMKLGEELEQELHIPQDRIDLVDLAVASPLLQHEVAERGKLIRGTKEDFFRFWLRAWKEYQDTAKFRRLREQMLEKSLRA